MGINGHDLEDVRELQHNRRLVTETEIWHLQLDAHADLQFSEGLPLNGCPCGNRHYMFRQADTIRPNTPCYIRLSCGRLLRLIMAVQLLAEPVETLDVNYVCYIERSA